MSAAPPWLAALGAATPERLAPALPQPGPTQRAGGSTLSSTLPSATLSPTDTSTSLTTPAAAEGTSMVALSVPAMQMASSTAMRSPTFTNSSITGTESKSPMSGTFTQLSDSLRISAGERMAPAACRG